jgi:hypothetical protein
MAVFFLANLLLLGAYWQQVKTQSTEDQGSVPSSHSDAIAQTPGVSRALERNSYLQVVLSSVKSRAARVSPEWALK